MRDERGEWPNQLEIQKHSNNHSTTVSNKASQNTQSRTLWLMGYNSRPCQLPLLPAKNRNLGTLSTSFDLFLIRTKLRLQAR